MTSLFSVLASRVESGETSVEDALGFVNRQCKEMESHRDDPRIATVYQQNLPYMREVIKACLARIQGVPCETCRSMLM